MIKLEIQPYCERCEIFDPDIERPEKYCMKAGGQVTISRTDTIVRCSRRKLCEGLKRYLEKAMKEGHPNDT